MTLVNLFVNVCDCLKMRVFIALDLKWCPPNYIYEL